MIRALFISELKRTLPSNVLIGVAALVCLSVGERIALRATNDAQEAIQLIDGFTVAFILFSSFLFGAKAFGQLKDNHSSFLMSLPARRVRSWATIVTVNLAIAIAIGGLVGIIQLDYQTDITASMVVFVLLVHLSLFFLGCYAVLVFKRATSAGIAALLFGGAAAVFTALFYIYLETRNPSFLLSIQSFLLALMAWGSLSAFARAEFNDTRVRLGSMARLAVTTLVFFVALTSIVRANLPARWGQWNDDVYWAAVSDDGRRMVVLAQHLRYRLYRKVYIIDIHSGAITTTFVGRGLSQPIWSADGNVLNLLSNPLLLTGALTRFSAEGRELQTLRTPFFSILDLASRTGSDIWISGASGGRLNSRFYLRTGDSRGPFERIDVQAPSMGLNLVQRMQIALAGSTYIGPDEMAKQLTEKFPPPDGSPAGTVGAYWLQDFFRASEKPLVYIRADTARNRVTIFVHRGGSSWKRVLEDIPLAGSTVGRIAGSRGVVEQLGLADVDVDAPGQFMAYRKKEDTKFSLYVYDIANDRTVHLGDLKDAASQTAHVQIERLPGSDTRSISISRSLDFLYFPASYTFRRLTPPPLPAFRIWVDDMGNQILQDGSKKIVYVKPDGVRRQLWPSSGAEIAAAQKP